MRRQNQLEKQKVDKTKQKKIRKQQKKAGEIEKQTPETQETLRILQDDIILDNDENLNNEELNDEFQEFISGDKEPKILLTTSYRPTQLSY